MIPNQSAQQPLTYSTAGVAFRPEEPPAIDSTIDVVTPENIAFQYQVAGPFRRLPAFLVDLVVRAGIWAAVLVIAVMVSVQLTNSSLQAIGFTMWGILWFALEWFYGGILETYWNGQTVGKRIFQMRVLRTDGQPINGMQAVTRNVLRLVDLMPLIPLSVWQGIEGPYVIPTGMVGLVAAICSVRYQRLGDLVCGTMVVVENRRHLINTSKLVQQPDLQALIEQLPVNFVASRKLSNALGTYIERRRHLTRGRRVEISKHLGPALIAKLGLPEDVDHDLLLCALYHRVFLGQPKTNGMFTPSTPSGSLTSSPVETSPSSPAATGPATNQDRGERL